MIGGKKLPILKFVKDSIEDVPPEYEELKEVSNHNLDKGVNRDE